MFRQRHDYCDNTIFYDHLRTHEGVRQEGRYPRYVGDDNQENKQYRQEWQRRSHHSHNRHPCDTRCHEQVQPYWWRDHTYLHVHDHNDAKMDRVDTKLHGNILHEALWSEFRKIDAQPSIVCEIIDKSTLLQFVADGLGIALAPARVQNIVPPDVVFVPFEPCDNQIDLYVAFRKSGNSDTVERFVEAVRANCLS